MLFCAALFSLFCFMVVVMLFWLFLSEAPQFSFGGKVGMVVLHGF